MKRTSLCLLALLLAACTSNSNNNGSDESGGAGGSDSGKAGTNAGGGGKATGTGGGSNAGGGGSKTPGAGGGAGTTSAKDAGLGDAQTSHWVGTWVTAPQKNEPHNLPPIQAEAGVESLAGNTLRQAVRVTIGGSQLRLKLTNEYGNGVVKMDSVHVAEYKGDGNIETKTDTAVKFNGSTSVSIEAGKFVTSDTFNYTVAPLSRVAISIHFTEVPADITGHPGSRTDSYVQKGDAVKDASLPDALKKANWYYIMGLDVMADNDTAAAVVFGDSIPDGRGSTTNGNDRWPDIIANRLQENDATKKVALLNLGIGGNNILRYGLGPTAIERFKHDVLDQAGVKWLVVAEGVNDIGTGGPDVADAGTVDGGKTYEFTSAQIADDLIKAYKDFIAKAHQNNIKAYAVPIPPIGQTQYYVVDPVAPTPDADAGDAGGDEYAKALDNYRKALSDEIASPFREAARAKVNKWMTDNVGKNGGFDAVMDLADPITNKDTTPWSMLKEFWAFNGSDALHPSAEGHKKMGEAADLDLFVLK